MSDLLFAAVFVLAVYRATRLLVADEFPPVRVPREALDRWLDPDTGRAPLGAVGRSIAYLITCPWCAGVWVAAVSATALAWWVPGVPHWSPLTWVLLAAAAAAVTGLLSEAAEALDALAEWARHHTPDGGGR